MVMNFRARLLQASRNYDEMFTAFAQAAPEEWKKWGQSLYRDRLTWAKQTFKSNSDWITWYLRWLRISMEQGVAKTNADVKPLFERDLSYFRSKMQEDPMWLFPDLYVFSQGIWGVKFQHFMAMPVPEIQQYRPGFKPMSQVVSELQAIEKKWQESRKHVLQPKEEDEALITFPDGWAWYLLPRSYCSDEARAMGHCGNGGGRESERILSLREPKKRGDWEPHCTFILDRSGLLGEMKGRNNAKPIARYHTYIVALLKNPIVKGIKGGGYAPERNFSISDLPKQDQEALFTAKPILMPAVEYLKQYGPDQALVNKLTGFINSTLNEDGEADAVEWDINKKALIGKEWPNFRGLVDNRGNDTAQHVMKVCEGEQDLNDDYLPGDEVEQVLDALDKETVTKLGQILHGKYPVEWEEWLENKGLEQGEWNPSDKRQVESLLDDVDDYDMRSALQNAWRDGWRWGTEAQMMDDLKKALEHSAYRPDAPESGYWDGPWRICIPVEKAARMMDDNETRSLEKAMQIVVEEPRYGWSDFDPKGAVESFPDRYENFDEEYAEYVGVADDNAEDKAALPQRHLKENFPLDAKLASPNWRQSAGRNRRPEIR